MSTRAMLKKIQSAHKLPHDYSGPVQVLMCYPHSTVLFALAEDPVKADSIAFKVLQNNEKAQLLIVPSYL